MKSIERMIDCKERYKKSQRDHKDKQVERVREIFR